MASSKEFIDFDSVSGEVESKADSMAGEFLIDSKAYKKFAAASGEDNESLLSLQVLGEILMLAGFFAFSLLEKKT